MKKFFKPYSLLFYLLTLILFFFVGVFYAVFTDAAKDQGLAAAAIVLGYGVMAGALAFVASIFVAGYSGREFIINTNRILSILLFIALVMITIRVINRKSQQSEPTEPENPKPSPVTKPAESVFQLIAFTQSKRTLPESGLGMFKPALFENYAFYFYGNINPDKPVYEHSPVDSITFQPVEGGGFAIATAPPWLVPAHLKLDYDILYFRIVSVSDSFVEVIVNETNGQTAYIDR